MTNAIKVLLQMPTGFLQLESTLYCYTSCTRQSIVKREDLEHDERSEECSKGTSSTTCLVQRV
jgi:hypothetical protein